MNRRLPLPYQIGLAEFIWAVENPRGKCCRNTRGSWVDRWERKTGNRPPMEARYSIGNWMSERFNGDL